MNREVQKALTFFGSMAVLVVAAGGVAMRLLGQAAGPDAAILGELKDTEDEAIELPVDGAAPLRVSRHHYQRVTVEADLEARSARATATLDLEGKLGPVTVSSVGLERIPFEYRDGEWVPTRGLAPLLTGALAALDARRRAIDQGDLAALAKLAGSAQVSLERDDALREALAVRGREYRVEAWYLRPDHEGVQVREEFRLVGDTPDQPIDQKGARILKLKEDGGKFFFASGLM